MNSDVKFSSMSRKNLTDLQAKFVLINEKSIRGKDRIERIITDFLIVKV
jgi:hypothetical protein